MGSRLYIYFYGFVISFLGSLPLGTLNLTAFNIAALQSIREALFFSIAVVLVELIIVRITLAYTRKINFRNKIFLYVIPIGILVLLYLAVNSFMTYYSAGRPDLIQPSLPLIKSSFLLGLVLSLSNPMHIPFWMTWNGILKAKNHLHNRPGMYTSYILGIGLGSIGGLLVFIYAGAYVFQHFQQYNIIITLTMGCLYFLVSLYLMMLYYKNHLRFQLYTD